MAFGEDEAALFQRFGCQYRFAGSKPLLELERDVFGCNYGSTSWTTEEEATSIARLLHLGPGTRVLDIGSGSGWPALYWAKTTRCSTVLIDVPLEGLRAASRRAEEDQLNECWIVGASGTALPFRDQIF